MYLSAGTVSKYPAISATTSVDPAAVAKETCPAAPTFTVTRFGMVCPAAKLRFDTFEAAVPVGYAVRKLSVVPAVAVTFNTTAAALAGMPVPGPATVSSLGVPATNGVVFHPPVVFLESRTRVGFNG